ncbi:sensor histidine kinase [Paenibacillus mendelii]|uniref:histidine kinase n=1 Tax=Paenibacillus mendelii TaxID=206163 RepID=A0ABV6J9Q3_9BACL|nr:sensor histidine kinase [Paenibacillus mendelii]MCQ6561113.1 sensor histidine kinase [Paenibacillus mendelii]
MKTRIVNWFRSQRIQNKIIAIYFPLVVIPLLLLSVLSYNINTEAVIKKTKKNMLDESRLITTRIDTILSNAESFSNIAMLDLNKETKLKTLEPKEIPYDELQTNEDYVLRNQIENKLDFAMLIFHDVESAVFIDNNRNIYSTDPKLNTGTLRGLASPMFHAVEKSNGIHLWFPMQRRDYWVMDKQNPVITIGKKILDTETMDTLGYLFVNINEKTLSSVYRPVGPVQSNGYYIVDSRGTIISSSDEERLLQSLEPDKREEITSQETVLEEMRSMKGEKVLLTAMQFGKPDWKLINEIPLKELTRETRQVTSLIWIVGGICLLFALIGAFILSKSIAAPIIYLAKHVKGIRDENIDRPIDVKSNDEIGILGSGVNTMLGRVNDLLIKVKEEQQQKREYELALIQEQIKPHFFYNSLDLIYVLCKSGESEEAGKATKALADFYRIALSNGKEIITVREEIRNLHSYLYIQSARYSDLFDFQIQIPNELLNYTIPKLTLQPLVENAIYHGLKEKGSFGHITIEGFKQGDTMCISVKDDGIGFPAERMKHWHTSKEERSSFGLSSVDERIKLYFGDRYGIRIHSQLGEGTDITVEIPLMNGDKHDD